jgi:FkbM family methyltransferase
MGVFKTYLKKNFPFFHLFYRNLKYRLRIHFVPKLREDTSSKFGKITRLGSEHGWSFLEKDYLKSCILISVGVGEDISFDVDFANRFNAQVYLVDPTPISLLYFQLVKTNFGKPKKFDYVEGGVQPVDSYELTNVSNENFRLISKALWIYSGFVEFYAPRNPDHNSFSITNLQGTAEKISVPCITFRDLLSELEIDLHEVGILKLDIEGAATEVLANIIYEGFRPKQILVEFEEVFVLSIRNLQKLRHISELLDNSGYFLVYSDHIANFTFEYQSVHGEH